MAGPMKAQPSVPDPQFSDYHSKRSTKGGGFHEGDVGTKADSSGH